MELNTAQNAAADAMPADSQVRMQYPFLLGFVLNIRNQVARQIGLWCATGDTNICDAIYTEVLMTQPAIGYLSVSTREQGRSGLPHLDQCCECRPPGRPLCFCASHDSAAVPYDKWLACI